MAGAPNGSPAGQPPDQTIGYESVSAADVAAGLSMPKAEPTPPPSPTVAVSVTPQTNTNVRSPSFTPSFGGFGKSIVTAGGSRVAPEALIGPYEVLDELGKGGMGVVYKARHIHLNRIVALKMILGGVHVSDTHVSRFQQEAEAVARLNHANIVQVYDVGESNGAPYIALELVEGGSLASKTEGKPQSPRYAAQMVETVCRAVHAAHVAGVIHRDLKPHNVLLTLDGQPKVTDFGLAKDLAQESGQTHAGSILGTPSYMSPEQAAGRIQDIGPGTDIYAMGCVLYELLTGHPPFRGESPIATIRMVLEGEVVPPRAIIGGIPRDLDTICLKALQKPTHRRYLTADAFAEDLRRFLDGEPIEARPVGPAERLWKWVRRNPTKATAIVFANIFGVVLLALGVWSYVAITRQKLQAEEARATAQLNLDESVRRMVRLNVANGTRMLDTNDYLNAPLWFAEALRLEPGGPDRVAIHRMRLRAVFDHCPRTSQLWLHEAALTEASYDAAGGIVLSASDDGIARVWKTTDGSPAGLPLEHGSPVRAAVPSPDGQTAVTGGADGQIRIWSVADGRLKQQLNNGSPVVRLAFAPDNAGLYAAGLGGRVHGWDVATGRERFTLDFTDKVTSLVLSPDGKLLAAGSKDGTARVCDATTGAMRLPLKHARGVTAVAFTPDGTRLVSGSTDQSVRVWDLLTGQPVHSLRHPAAVTSVAVTPDGRHVVTGCDDATAKVWDLTTGQPVGRPASHDGPVVLVAVSPDGRWFASGGDDNTVRVWDVRTGEPLGPPLRHNAVPVAIRFSPNGYELLIADQTRAVRVWNLITHGELSGTTIAPAVGPPLPPPRDDVQTLTSANGDLSVTFGGGQAVRVRQSRDHEPVTPLLRSGAAVTAAAFGPDSQTLATGDQDGNVQCWTATDGKPLWTTPGRHVSRVVQVVFSPTGDRLATSSDDNTARIWDATTGTPRIPPVRLGGTVHALEFSADGKLFYTETSGGRSRVWDAATGEPVTPPFAPRKDWVNSLVVAQWPVESMLAAGRMLSSQRLSDAGDVLPNDAESLRNDWKELKTSYAVVAQTPPAAVVAWRLRQVTACERADQWFAAGWHLDQLIAADPDQPDYRRRRAIASAKLGDWKRAADDAGRAIRLQPELPENWYQRGVARGQLGDWHRSAADLNKALQLKADPTAVVGLSAKVRLADDDLPGYRRAAADALAQCPDDADPGQARSVVWACLLGDSGTDASRLLTFADVGLRHQPSGPVAQVIQATALLRANRVDEAAARLKELCADVQPRPVAWVVYGLALRRLGKASEADAWHDKARRWLDEQTQSGRVPLTWDDRTDLEILLREADGRR